MTRTFAGECFTKYGSDKDTNHSYGEIYERLFPNREKVECVLEIGIASGGSCLAFRDIFPNALIVGFDKEPCHRAEVGSEDASIYPLTPRPERLEIHQGDMRNRDDLLRAVNGRLFDLIVEDATHILDDNLRTLFWLWPFVKEGGFYIIEEMANVQAHLDCLSVLVGVRIVVTPQPIPNEVVVILKKPTEQALEDFYFIQDLDDASLYSR